MTKKVYHRGGFYETWAEKFILQHGAGRGNACLSCGLFCVYQCMHMCVCFGGVYAEVSRIQVSVEAEILILLETGVIGSCESFKVGPRNQQESSGRVASTLNPELFLQLLLGPLTLVLSPE